MPAVLLVDDSDEICEMVRVSLTYNSSIELTVAKRASAALERLESKPFELILLDIALPDGDGLNIFENLKSSKKNSQTPVIFLTSKIDVATKIAAYTLDAEDFIEKPINVLELKARIESRLRRLSAAKRSTDEYRIGPFVFELASHRLFEKDQEGYIDLTSREFKILLLMARHPQWIFSRETIIKEVWPVGIYVSERAIDTHICMMRKKLSATQGGTIESVQGEGYRFVLNPAKGKKKPSAKDNS